MKKLYEKLFGSRGTAGETLVEAMCAMVVACLAMMMLAMAISVSTDIIRKGNVAAEDYYNANSNLVAYAASGEGSSSDTDGVITVTSNVGGSATTDTVNNVRWVAEEVPGDETIISYRV